MMTLLRYCVMYLMGRKTLLKSFLVACCILFFRHVLSVALADIVPSICLFPNAELSSAIFRSVGEGQKFPGTYVPVSLRLLRIEQNGRHFTDDMFKRIFLNENVLIWNKISLKYVPWDLIDNMPALVAIMAWRRSGDKPLSKPMLTQLVDAYKRH